MGKEDQTEEVSASSFTVSNVEPFNFSASNLAEEWKLWKKKFDMFEMASNLESLSSQRRVAMLLHSMGGSAIEIYNSFNLKTADQYKIETVVNKLNEHFQSKAPITLIRHKFFTCKQVEGQSIMEYVTELQNLSLSCKFENLRLELVRDIFIAGLLNNKLKIMLLKEQNLDIDKAVNMCRAVEASMDHVASQQEINVMKVTHGHAHRKPTTSQKFVDYNEKKFGNKKSVKCYRCGRFGHIKKNCRVKLNVSNVSSHEEDSTVYDYDSDDLFVGQVVFNVSSCDPEWFEELTINDCHVKFNLDTGSPVNIMSLFLFQNIFKDCKKPKLVKKNWNLGTLSNEKIPVVGCVYLLCKLGEKFHRILLFFFFFFFY
ncbi:hypothetical protein WDU94_005559 [Cyamophila willieti]